MDRYEAELAVISAALCEHRGIVYYAYSVVYTKNPRGTPMWSIVLHERRANTTVQVPLEQVKVVNWNLPADFVAARLSKMRGAREA